MTIKLEIRPKRNMGRANKAYYFHSINDAVNSVKHGKLIHLVNYNFLLIISFLGQSKAERKVHKGRLP